MHRFEVYSLKNVFFNQNNFFKWSFLYLGISLLFFEVSCNIQTVRCIVIKHTAERTFVLLHTHVITTQI